MNNLGNNYNQFFDQLSKLLVIAKSNKPVHLNELENLFNPIKGQLNNNSILRRVIRLVMSKINVDTIIIEKNVDDEKDFSRN